MPFGVYLVILSVYVLPYIKNLPQKPLLFLKAPVSSEAQAAGDHGATGGRLFQLSALNPKPEPKALNLNLTLEQRNTLRVNSKYLGFGVVVLGLSLGSYV